MCQVLELVIEMGLGSNLRLHMKSFGYPIRSTFIFPIGKLLPLCGKLGTLFFACPSSTFSLIKLCVGINFSSGSSCFPGCFRGHFSIQAFVQYISQSPYGQTSSLTSTLYQRLLNCSYSQSRPCQV